MAVGWLIVRGPRHGAGPRDFAAAVRRAGGKVRRSPHPTCSYARKITVMKMRHLRGAHAGGRQARPFPGCLAGTAPASRELFSLLRDRGGRQPRLWFGRTVRRVDSRARRFLAGMVIRENPNSALAPAEGVDAAARRFRRAVLRVRGRHAVRSVGAAPVAAAGSALSSA